MPSNGMKHGPSARWLLALILALMASFSTPPAFSAMKQSVEPTISIGVAVEVAQELSDTAASLAGLVARQSRGTLRPELVKTNLPGRQLLQMARAGSIDLIIVPNSQVAAIRPEFQALELPFLFSGREHVGRVLDGPVGEELLARLEQVRLHGLAFWDLGMVHLSRRDRPIRRASDLRGLRIGVSSGARYLPETLEALGAQVTVISAAEQYSAMQVGMIEAGEWRLISFLARRGYEVQRTLSLTRHRYLAAPVMVNWGLFSRMQDYQKQALVRAARSLGEQLRAQHASDDSRRIVEIRERGVEVIESPEMGAAHDIAWKVAYWDFAKRSSFDVLDAIERLR